MRASASGVERATSGIRATSALKARTASMDRRWPSGSSKVVR